MSIAWWYWWRISPLALIPLGQEMHARIAAAAVELVALPHLERRVERHRPAVRVMVVGLRASELVDHRQVRLDVVGNLVDELVLVERAVRAALAAGAVVRDKHDDRVLELLGLLQVREQAADLIIGVREEPRVHLGHPTEQPALVVGQRTPRAREVELRERLAVRALAVLWRPDRVERRELRVLGDDPELLLALERLLAHCLIAHVEAALVLLDPLLRHVVRGVARPRRVVQEERLVRRDRLGVLDELERPVGQVHRQVVALLGLGGLVDRMVVVDQVRMPLVGLRAEEAVEALEPTPRRPVAPGRGEMHLVGRAQMPLARHVRVPAELAEDLRQHPVLRRDRAARVREPDRGLGDARHAVARVIATRQQARPCRRTQRRRVPLRVADPAGGDPVDVRRLHRPAVTADRRESQRRRARCTPHSARRPEPSAARTAPSQEPSREYRR